ncbi:hypothetical protein ABBQ38_010591 [Trebouxia sp. C0009 RCD-2024]
MHKTVYIAERARHKPDKAARERAMICANSGKTRYPTSRFRNDQARTSSLLSCKPISFRSASFAMQGCSRLK